MTSCYYAPDLEAETVGSVGGGVATGLAMAYFTSELVAIGAGTIVGSVIGGILGQEIDNFSPLRIENPPEDPVPLFYYKTTRAPLIQERFEPARIITNANKLPKGIFKPKDVCSCTATDTYICTQP